MTGLTPLHLLDEAESGKASRLHRTVERKARNPVTVEPAATQQGRSVVVARTIIGRGEAVHALGLTTVAALEALNEMLDRRAARKPVRPPRRR